MCPSLPLPPPPFSTLFPSFYVLLPSACRFCLFHVKFLTFIKCDIVVVVACVFIHIVPVIVIVFVAVVRDGQLGAINNWLPRCKYPVNRVQNLPTASVWTKQSILFARYKLCYTFLCLVTQRKQLVKQKVLPTFGHTLK